MSSAGSGADVVECRGTVRIEVDRCKTVIVCKRSLNPGFAGIDNPLYTNDNTMMFFGDAKASVEDLTREMREI